MKLDHFIINISEKYQIDTNFMHEIRNVGYPYEPKWGKGTRGFKASNIWIGNEYLEMINILKVDGGGWKTNWTEFYNDGHRGLICLMLDTENLDELYKKLKSKNIQVTTPEYLKFKWFFNLFTRTMPWENSYVKFFKNIPLQIGFQQMKNEKARSYMEQYMVPNSRDKGILGINKVVIKGSFSIDDFQMLKKIFDR